MVIGRGNGAYTTQRCYSAKDLIHQNKIGKIGNVNLPAFNCSQAIFPDGKFSG